MSESREEYYKNNIHPNKGKSPSEETRRKSSETQKNLPIVECKYCGFKTRSVGNIRRWHNDNCRNKKK